MDESNEDYDASRQNNLKSDDGESDLYSVDQESYKSDIQEKSYANSDDRDTTQNRRQEDIQDNEDYSVGNLNTTDDVKNDRGNYSDVGDSRPNIDDVQGKNTSVERSAHAGKTSEDRNVHVDAKTKDEHYSKNQPSNQNETQKARNKNVESKQTKDSSFNKNEKGKTTKKKRALSANSSSSMSSLRSSVRPKSSKQPWGTIIQPEFGLGYQKMTEYEIAQTVDRLYKIPTPKERVYDRPGKKISAEEYDEMMQRMTKIDPQKITDSDRRVQSSIYSRMGVVSSYAWKGYN